MLTEEQIKERIRLSTITVDGRKELSIEECLKALSNEGLEKLYSRYDISDFYSYDARHSKKTTKTEKIKYLVEEIPGQFIDYYTFMINKTTQTKVKKICYGENIKINDDIFGLAYYGFIYFSEKNNETEILIPYELANILEYIK